ncbi:MAG: septum formation initiator family protein [Actinobacteria bacterium]|nr:septum formation initiator family protein [Actinomycetota bacterium]
MSRNTQVISSISRKTKLNITSVVFILFIIISIIVSINPIVMMISKRNQISSLENKLNVTRKEDIELLAVEKSLYNDEIIKQEALKQFNIAAPDDKIVYKVNEIDKLKRRENLKILYYKEIYKPNN